MAKKPTDAELRDALDPKTDRRRGAAAIFEPGVSKERKAEQTTRVNKATRRTLIALRELHPDEYDRIYTIARAEVDAERGPLPGAEEARAAAAARPVL